MDGRMFEGIGTLMVLGVVMMGLLICLVPAAAFYAVAWVAAPRLSFDPFAWAFWLSAAWIIAAGGGFLWLLFGPR